MKNEVRQVQFKGEKMETVSLRNKGEMAVADLPVQLNIGCGWDHRDGFLNVDLNDFHEPDLVADACKLEALPDAHFRLILAQDILEHLERGKTQVALNEWARLLQPEGIVLH